MTGMAPIDDAELVLQEETTPRRVGAVIHVA